MTRLDLPEYPFHEIAEVFPLMTGQDFEDLKRDIDEHGQREPIWLYQGRIIDGRNRYRACRDLGRPVLRREWDGNGSLIAFVQSLNLRRRHLDETQRAMVAAKIKRRFEEEARERQSEQAHRGQEGGRGNVKIEPLNPSGKFAQRVHEERPREKAAREMNVSPRSVEAASKVLREGVPDLVKAVERGDVAVSAAAEVARLPKIEQEPVVQAGPSAIVRRAAEVRTERVQVRRAAEPKVKPKPEESEDEAANLLMKWSKTTGDIHFRLSNTTDDQIRSLATILKSGDRKAAIDELKEFTSTLTRWIKILEKNK